MDLINTADPAARAAEVEALGVDIVCVHTAFDVQHHSDPLQELRAVRGAVDRCVLPSPRSLANVYTLKGPSDRVLMHECRGSRRVSDLILSSS